MERIGYGAVPSDRLDAVFSALADPTRRAILGRLSQGDASVNELTAPFDMSQPAVSKHLKVLERAGLVVRSRDAQRRPVHAEAAPLAEVARWLEAYRRALESNFSRLDRLLATMNDASPATIRHRQRHTKPRGARKER